MIRSVRWSLSPNHVELEYGFVLSRISAISDEVIGYKSPVFQDNSLAGVMEVSLVVVS